MRYYPILLDLSGRKAVVVGGGTVAERKVRMLLRCGGRITVVSPSLSRRLKSLTRQEAIQHKPRPYRTADLRDATLVLAATNDPEVQIAVARDAQRRGLLVNVVDRPELSSFIAPSVLAWGDLLIAISTGGASPALAQKIRRDLERQLGPAYAEFLSILGPLRGEIRRQIPSQARRRRLFHQIVHSDLLGLLQEGKKAEAVRKLQRLLARVGVVLQPKSPKQRRRSVIRRQSSRYVIRP